MATRGWTSSCAPEAQARSGCPWWAWMLASRARLKALPRTKRSFMRRDRAAKRSAWVLRPRAWKQCPDLADRYASSK